MMMGAFPPERGADERSKRRRLLGVGGLLVLVGVVLPLLANVVSPRPALWVIRPLFNRPLDVVGLFGEDLARVVTHPKVPLSVRSAPDASLTFFTPKDAPGEPSDGSRPLVLWIHGGGWVAGSPEQIGTYTKVLASQGVTVASLDYALAPGQKYPTPVQQAVAALDYLLEHASEYGADATRVFIGGDSAGAQLASQVAALVTNADFRQQMGIDAQFPAANLRGVVLYCGLYNMTTVGATGFPAIRTFLWSYTGHRDYLLSPRIHEMSTVRHVTREYPPTYLTVGDGDWFETQARELERVLRSRSVPVTSRYWTGSGRRLPHEYQFRLDTEPGRVVLNDVVQFIKGSAR
jgi:acetyl esterase